MKGEKPSYLYTSGNPGRCSPAGVACLYASESEATATNEYLAPIRGTSAEMQPRLTFFARVELARVIDCGMENVRAALGLEDVDFYGSWRLAPALTRLQRLGQAISLQQSITAIRFPSSAIQRLGKTGWNVAVFPSALAPPDRVEILGPDESPLEMLP